MTQTATRRLVTEQSLTDGQAAVLVNALITAAVAGDRTAASALTVLVGNIRNLTDSAFVTALTASINSHAQTISDAGIAALKAGVDPAYDTLLELRAAMASDETVATALATLVGAIRAMTDSTTVAAIRVLISADIIDTTSSIGAAILSGLATKVTLPPGGSGGNALILDPTTGQVVWGVSPGALSLLTDGTLQVTITAPTGSDAIILEGGGFMNGIVGPNPAYSVQNGAPLELHGDVYGAYASLDLASTWLGSNDGVFDVKHMKGITVFKSKTSPNVSYRYSSNWNLTNAGSVVSGFWKHTYDPTARRIITKLLFDTAGSTSVGAQANLYRAMGDGASHPRQTGKMGEASPTQDGVGWLCHGDGVVQYNETTGVTLKALNGAAAKNECSGMAMDPVKDPSTGVDLYVSVAKGTDAGVHHITNVQLAGVAGSGGGPSITKLTGGAAPVQPMAVVALNVLGVTRLLVTDAGLPGTAGGLRYWDGTTWTDVTPTGGPGPSSGMPGYASGLVYPAAVPAPPGGTSNTGVIVFKALDAVVLPGGTIRCVVGHDGPDQAGQSKMLWTDDALTPGSGWHSHVDSDNQANYPQKGSGKLWWLANAPNGAPYSYFAMTKAQGGWDASDIWIDRTNVDKCYASGRSGLWSFDISQVNPVNAQPADNGVGAAICIAAAFSPVSANTALVADSDWTCLHWIDINNEPRLVQHTSGTVALPGNVDGREVRIDVLGGGYVGQAQRNTFNSGDIWYTASTTTATGWYSLMHGNNPGLSAWTDYGVRGFTVTRHTDGDMVITAFLGPQITGGDPTHAGIWRLKGTWNATTHAFEIGGVAQTWTRVSSIYSTFTNQFQFVRSDVGRTVTDAMNQYSYDPLTSGLVRSTDYGATQTSIFPRTFRNVYRYAGGVKCDKLVANRVWITIPGTGGAGEVWRIDNAHNGTLSSSGATLTGTITATKVNTGVALIDCPGQLVVKTDGSVIVHQGVSGAGTLVGGNRVYHPGLAISTDSGVTWSDISNANMRGTAAFVYGMAISSDDQNLIMACDGNGTLRHPLAPPSQNIPLLTKAQILALVGGPLISDLNAITAMADGDMLERVGGHLVNRTKAQVKADLALLRPGIVSANAAMLPSPTANTDGTAVAVVIPTGYTGIAGCEFDYITTGVVGGETITVHFAVTYDDASTTNVSPTSTTNTTVNSSSSQRRTFRKQGHYITSITIAVKSSIAGSAASVAVNFTGEAI